ncbi:MAG: RHS repeat protein [Deltaproteobacteria bacterium]|nr:RHS repeat protein [Deltaproteobacteria bacterium]
MKTVDALGNAVRQGYCADVGCPSCGGGGSSGVCSATDALGNTTVTRFDPLGRATESISPTGSVTVTELDSLGRQSKTIDALGNETRYLYDELGRLWKVIDALGGVTEYGFDERGNRTSVRDAMGNLTRFEYDLNNRLTKEINPLGIETSFTYDATGSRATRTDGNGFTTIYRYDPNRRLSEIEYPDGKKTQYAFDERGNKTFEGYVDPEQSFAATSRTFSYDDLNRLRSMTDSSLGKTIQYECDKNGNRSAVIDAEGGLTKWEYDRNNRPVKVTDSDGQVTRFEYDAAGRRTKVVYPNGVWTEYLYDTSSQLTYMVTRDRTNLILQGWHYVYDLRGNRTSKADYAGNVEAYLYDALGRLIETTYPDGRVVAWSYDAVGNRLTQTGNGSLTAYSYNAANQIQTMTSPTGAQTTFGFDGNGNMLWKSEPSGMTYFTWDFENRLRQVSSPSGLTNFEYDANGIRVFKESGGVRTDYLIDTVSVLAEYEAGLKKAAYVLGPRIDEIISARLSTLNSQPSANEKYWYLTDALGSVTALTDSVGRVIKTYRYGAWGEDHGTTGPDLRNPYRWTGREWDRTGLQYNRARYVLKDLGQWATPDPLLSDGNAARESSFMSAYVYANAKPTVLTDSSGRRIDWDSIIDDAWLTKKWDAGSQYFDGIINRVGGSIHFVVRLQTGQAGGMYHKGLTEPDPNCCGNVLMTIDSMTISMEETFANMQAAPLNVPPEISFWFQNSTIHAATYTLAHEFFHAYQYAVTLSWAYMYGHRVKMEKWAYSFARFTSLKVNEIDYNKLWNQTPDQYK